MLRAFCTKAPAHEEPGLSGPYKLRGAIQSAIPKDRLVRWSFLTVVVTHHPTAVI